MSALSVLYQTVLLTGLIFTGYGFTKIGLFTKEHSDGLTTLLLDLFVPCTVLAATKNDLGSETGQTVFRVIGIFALLLVLYTLLGSFTARLLKLDEDTGLVFSRCTAHCNNGFMGIPLATSVFGSIGTIWCVLTLLCTNVYVFAGDIQAFRRDRDGSLKEKVKGMITPINVSTVLMLVLMLSGIHLPGFALDFINYFAACNTPAAMLVVGNMLACAPLLDAFRRPSIYVLTFLRNIVCPFIAILLLLPTGWNREMCLCIVMMAGCSIASVVSVIARRYDRSPTYAGHALLHSTVLLPVTLPVMMWFASFILP